jgi:Beta-lactamase class C and other penicillin binding proteins
MKSIFVIFLSVSIIHGVYAQQKSNKNKNSIQLLHWVEGMVQSHQMAGAGYLIFQDDKIIARENIGFRDFKKKVLIDEETIFRITSMTKPITAVAIMTLYEDGYFVLSDPVSKYIPVFNDVKVRTDSSLRKPIREITIWDLLLNTSGLPSFNSDAYNQLMDTVTNSASMVEGLAHIPLDFDPGSHYEYGSSYEVLGYLIEVLTRMTLEQYLEKRLFKPLRMNHTYFFVPNSEAYLLSGAYQSSGSEVLKETRPPGRETVTNQRFFDGAGGLKSTVGDYFKFCRMLLNGGTDNDVYILSRNSVQMIMQDHLGELYPEYYEGNGWGMGGEVVIGTKRNELSHIGTYRWSGFYGNSFFIDPDKRIIAIFMTQLFPHNELNIIPKFEILSRLSCH